MRMATWNVNSIRSRCERVLTWLKANEVDVLAMQETKCRDDQFPLLPFEEAGYEVVCHGFNQWNGVAIASRVGIDAVERGFPGMPTWGDPPVVEARALGATCDGIRLWSLYIPNGRSLSDPHLAYKLQWLRALQAAGIHWLSEDPQSPIILAGDWNVAPYDDDVWSMAAFTESTHVSPVERAAFTSVVNAGFADIVRPYTPGPGVYTYWDYTQLRFPRKEGMRIDFMLASDGAARHVTYAAIDREARKGKSPSDHAPVYVDVMRKQPR